MNAESRKLQAAKGRSGRTAIPWVERIGAKPEGLNPFRGCKPKSRGCRRCWAALTAMRAAGTGEAFEGLVRDGKWMGALRVVPELLMAPLLWRKPRVAFVGSMSDIARPAVQDQDLDTLFAAMLLAPQHVYLLVTKWPERLAEYLGQSDWRSRIERHARELASRHMCRRSETSANDPWEARLSLWIGASVEDQSAADERLPAMRAIASLGLQTGVSSEPRLGPIDWTG